MLRNINITKNINFSHDIFYDVTFKIITGKKVSWSPLLQRVKNFLRRGIRQCFYIFSRVKMLVQIKKIKFKLKY